MKPLTLTLLLTLASFTSRSQTKNFLDQPYLEVAGNADTLVIPNEIYIGIGITERDTRDRVSVEELESNMYEALKRIGIDVDRNLMTSDMGSNFKFHFLKSKDVLKSRRYVLKVEDAATAGRVFVELESLGISNTYIDRVEHSGAESIKNRMRGMAMENARSRAAALTRPLNQTIGPAIHIADNEVYNSSGTLNEVVVMGYSSRKTSRPEPPKLEFEKIRIVANIAVKFVLK